MGYDGECGGERVGEAVVAVDAGDFFDEVDFAFEVETPGGEFDLKRSVFGPIRTFYIPNLRDETAKDGAPGHSVGRECSRGRLGIGG